MQISCHSFVELIKTLREKNLYQNLATLYRHLALLFEQITYETNTDLQYELYPKNL